MIDLHLHLLHATDDGAADLDQAAAMARLAAADGCTALVATPHQRRDEWRTADEAVLRARLAEIGERVGDAPRLLLGAEVRVDSEILADLDDRARSGVQTLAGSRYVLLELEPEGIGPDPVELVNELGARGLVPVFAHPELVPFLWEEGMSSVAPLVEAGGLLQVTAMSVTGEFGRGAKERALALVDAGWVQFVASDAHRPDWRPPGLSAARAALAKQFGEAVARELTHGNPLAVVENRALPGLPASRRGFEAVREAR